VGLELDHVFCFCDPTLPEAKTLEAAGFVLTRGTRHAGQGTANRSAVFGPQYLELIYLSSAGDARANPMRLHLRALWKETGRSPFGIALRGEVPEREREKFWEYHPPYAPGRVILVHRASEETPGFPVLFITPPPGFKNLSNEGNAAKITSVQIETRNPAWPLSIQIPGLKLTTGASHRMTITLSGEAATDLVLNEALSLERDS
jgi:hypothetical protein